MRRVAARAGHPFTALAATVVLMSVWVTVVRPMLPPDLHPVAGLVIAGCSVAFGRWGGLDADGMGLAPGRLTDGLRYGGLAFVAVTAVVLLGLVSPMTRHPFHSSRADITVDALLLHLLVTIPLGTVVVEELAFRGTMLGLLRLAVPTVRAVVTCSVLFGLWHVPGALRATSGSHGQVLTAAAGTFLATFAAGVGFSWLRIRSGSLLAPAMAHLATNAVALIVAWFVVRP